MSFLILYAFSLVLWIDHLAQSSQAVLSSRLILRFLLRRSLLLNCERKLIELFPHSISESPDRVAYGQALILL